MVAGVKEKNMLLKKTLKYEKSCWLYFIGPVNGKTKEKGGTENPRDSVSSSLLVNPVCDLSRFHEIKDLLRESKDKESTNPWIISSVMNSW
ncbi:hypothetical protein V1478_016442 [Vespula squamosa]|uniref:Uncharacterized protein n=1 Tax=Vespula squamosa TaxID=30214 RepID=A0ABD2A2G2_VESSQ